MNPVLQQDQGCATCGWRNEVQAVYCAACGAVLPAVGDDRANAVEGAPVRHAPRPPAEALREAAESMVVAVRDSVGHSVRESVGRSVRESVAQTIVQSVSHVTEAIEDPNRKAEVRRHLARIGLAPQPPAPVYLPPPISIERRIAYVVLVGSWLSILWLVATWVTMLSVVGRPLADRLIDAAPRALTLRPTNAALSRWQQLGPYRAVHAQYGRQHPVPLRIVYFLLVGCWASLLWLGAAYIVTLAAGQSHAAETMFERAPAVAYLEQI